MYSELSAVQPGLLQRNLEEGRVVRLRAPDRFSEILFIYLDMRDFNYIYIYIYIYIICIYIYKDKENLPTREINEYIYIYMERMWSSGIGRWT